MFIVTLFIKILQFLFTRPLLLFFVFAIAVIIRWYFWGGIFAAIFIGILLFFIFIIILGIYSSQKSKKELEDEITETYIDSDEEGLTSIRSDIPTNIISRSDGNQTEHVILTKHKRLPRKITYE